MALLTVPEVAKRLRVHQLTVRRHIKDGSLPAVRVGRAIRVKEDDLNAFLEPTRATRQGTTEELRAWIHRELTPGELEQRRLAFERMTDLRETLPPLGMSTATLVRVARRSREWVYGDKTIQEVIDEES